MPLNHLNQDALVDVLNFLDPKNQSAFGRTSKTAHAFFQEVTLLNQIIKSLSQQVEAILAQQPEYLLRKYHGVDSLGRKFHCVSIHYVLWAGDKKTLALIMQCLKKLPRDSEGDKIREAVLTQCQNFIDHNGLTYTMPDGTTVTELSFDFYKSFGVTNLLSAPSQPLLYVERFLKSRVLPDHMQAPAEQKLMEVTGGRGIPTFLQTMPTSFRQVIERQLISTLHHHLTLNPEVIKDELVSLSALAKPPKPETQEQSQPSTPCLRRLASHCVVS